MTASGHVFRVVALRLVRLAGVLFVVSALCFLSLNLLPGDPVHTILGVGGSSPQAVAQLRHQLGLDRPILTRFFEWLGNALHGNLGRSYVNNEPVSSVISSRAHVTLELILISQIIAIVVAVPAAALAAARRGSATDRGIGLWVFGVLSTPNFVIAFILIYVFAVKLHMYPANGYIPVSAGFGQHLGSLLLPSISLAAAPFALYQRVLRADLVETYGQEFIAVARAKGVSPVRIAFRHAMRPSLLGLTTSIGVTVGTLIGADVIVESIFSLPGLGAELVRAVNARDYVEVQGIVLVIATAFVLLNAVVDVLYRVVDPRLRTSAPRPQERVV